MLRYPASLAATITGTHQLAARADLWYAGRLMVANLPILDGTVTLDGGDTVRGRLTMTVADTDGSLVPVGTKGLTPFGGEIHVQRGAVVPGIGPVYVSLGWYRIQTATVTESYRQNNKGQWTTGGASIQIDALDRMSAVADSRLTSPGKPKKGTTCMREIKRLCAGLIPMSQWSDIEDEPTPAGMVYEESRLDAVTALATAIEAAAYASADGALELRPLKSGTPVWTFTGAATGGLLTVEQVASRDGVYNAVVARGEATGDKPPVQAIAYDVTPESPTRWGGPFGRVPTFYASPVITSATKAAKAARTRMDSQIRGRDRDVKFSAIPVPWLEPGDAITVTTPRIAFTGQLVAVTVPLSPGAAEYTVRALETGITIVDLDNDGTSEGGTS